MSLFFFFFFFFAKEQERIQQCLLKKFLFVTSVGHVSSAEYILAARFTGLYRRATSSGACCGHSRDKHAYERYHKTYPESKRVA